MSVSVTVARDHALQMRPASQVMQLERLGSQFQSRLSFVRSCLRRVMNEKWRIERTLFDLDRDGYGAAIYRVDTPHARYHAVFFSLYLPEDKRSDRVIADQWDVSFVLVKGEVDPALIEQLRHNVPLQEAGRNDPRILVLSRANKSVRNFDRFLSALADGQQPDPRVLAQVGYLYRTTAVYGNGKFGIADLECLLGNPDFSSPFSAQMFAVYLLRHFSIEQINHMARARNPRQAIELSVELQRYLGVGNATGLGMAPFLINHPQLIAQWINNREIALASVLRATADVQHADKLRELISRAAVHLGQTYTDDQWQTGVNDRTLLDLHEMALWLERQTMCANLWELLLDWSQSHAGVGCQELLVSLLLELYPERVDHLERDMGVVEDLALDVQMPLAQLSALIEHTYAWAFEYDFSKEDDRYYFWYRSAEKEEPRLGVRSEEPGAEKEIRLAVARDIQACFDTLKLFRDGEANAGDTVGHFLLTHPEHKGIVRRIQAMAVTAYGEIRTNPLDKDTLPIHLLRCKLAFFGAAKFDPKSSRWVRITLFQGAPLVSEIGLDDSDDWNFAVMPEGN